MMGFSQGINMNIIFCCHSAINVSAPFFVGFFLGGGSSAFFL